MSVIVTIFAGCPRDQQPAQPTSADSSPATRASVTLRVLVVNEPPLVEAINRLRGEWAERSGGELNVQSATWADISQAKSLDADLIIFPSRYLGELCTRDWLRPVRASVLDDEELNAADFFPLVRNEVIRWGGQTMALPLGVDDSAFTPHAGPKSIEFLSLAAPGAVSNERLGILFDAQTMKPRITEQAFVDALTKLPLLPKKGPGEVSSSSQPSIPILGYNDRIAAVTSSSHNAASAFQLLEWLARADTTAQLARVNAHQLPPRRSLASKAALWPDKDPQEQAELGKALTARLSEQQFVLVPRIPSIDEYLTALHDAVKAVIEDKRAAATALQKAADQWEQITTKLGRDKQRAAYLAHLGIE
jgi:hypothetical protein